MSLPKVLIHTYDVSVKTTRGSQEKKELTEKALPRIWTNPKLQEFVNETFHGKIAAVWDGKSLNCVSLSPDINVL